MPNLYTMFIKRILLPIKNINGAFFRVVTTYLLCVDWPITDNSQQINLLREKLFSWVVRDQSEFKLEGGGGEMKFFRTKIRDPP